jgi:hypothetical protein
LSGEGEEDILEHEIKVAGEDAITVTTYTLSNKFLTTSDGSVDYHVNYTQQYPWEPLSYTFSTSGASEYAEIVMASSLELQ